MSQICPANGGMKTKPPPPALASDRLSSTCDRQSPPYFPQSDTSVRQHMSLVNDSGVQARPPYRPLTSGNDAVGIEDSFRLVNFFFYMRLFFC
jgi:hypothetical protein